MCSKTAFRASLLLAVIALAACWSCSRSPSKVETEAVAAIEKDGVQEVKIRVKGEYTPERILVKKGIPLRLVFYRDNTSACTEHVVLEDFAIKQKLAPQQETIVSLTPASTGEFTFTCGMKMLEGKLIVRE